MKPLSKADPCRLRDAIPERDESLGFAVAAVLASSGLLGVVSMGTFPLSLIALGWIRRRNFDDTVTRQPKGDAISEECESPRLQAGCALIESCQPGVSEQLTPLGCLSRTPA